MYQPLVCYCPPSQLLERAADRFLKEHGFGRDGRPQGSVDRQQQRMERRLCYVPYCGKSTR